MQWISLSATLTTHVYQNTVLKKLWKKKKIIICVCNAFARFHLTISYFYPQMRENIIMATTIAKSMTSINGMFLIVNNV